ncbi:MAG: transglycosylase SLT domain-containing protein [Bacteroidaceae bacterium]|nr:transglycosylase SLT domain-containing protein [Bacteroidaceae bacterium]
MAACHGRDAGLRYIITPIGDTLYLNDTTPPPHALSYKEIKQKKQIRLLTPISNKTYYKYNGHHLGIQYLIVSEFAQDKGLEVVVDSCKDSTEVKARLALNEGDIAAMATPGDLRAGSKSLQDSINAWYNDTIVEYVKNIEQEWLQNGGIIRKKYPMFIDLKAQHYSQYDSLFKRYAKHCNWDWKLLVAQCYQESTFDPKAISWAGARGLMQIMPHIAEKINLPFSEMFTPEMNIKAAVKLIAELEDCFSFIRNKYERQNFILAAYNGGIAHIKDAMALAKADTVPNTKWDNVAPYVLLLATPDGYNHPVVQNGYMRGEETVGYVSSIRRIYATYGGRNRLTGKPYKTPTIGKKDEEEEDGTIEDKKEEKPKEEKKEGTTESKENTENSKQELLGDSIHQ